MALNKLLVRTEPQDARIRFFIQYELHNIRNRPSVARENRFPEKLVGIDAELCDFTEHKLPAREGKRVARRKRAPDQVALGMKFPVIHKKNHQSPFEAVGIRASLGNQRGERTKAKG